MIVKVQLTQSPGLDIGVLMHDREHRLVHKTTDADMISAALSILRGEPFVHIIGSVVNGQFEPQAHVQQTW